MAAISTQVTADWENFFSKNRQILADSLFEIENYHKHWIRTNCDITIDSYDYLIKLQAFAFNFSFFRPQVDQLIEITRGCIQTRECRHIKMNSKDGDPIKYLGGKVTGQAATELQRITNFIIQMTGTSTLIAKKNHEIVKAKLEAEEKEKEIAKLEADEKAKEFAKKTEAPFKLEINNHVFGPLKLAIKKTEAALNGLAQIKEAMELVGNSKPKEGLPSHVENLRLELWDSLHHNDLDEAREKLTALRRLGL